MRKKKSKSKIQKRKHSQNSAKNSESRQLRQRKTEPEIKKLTENTEKTHPQIQSHTPDIGQVQKGRTFEIHKTLFWFLVGAFGQAVVADFLNYLKSAWGYEFLIPPVHKSPTEQVPSATPTPSSTPTPTTPSTANPKQTTGLDWWHKVLREFFTEPKPEILIPVSLPAALEIIDHDRVGVLLAVCSAKDLIHSPSESQLCADSSHQNDAGILLVDSPHHVDAGVLHVDSPHHIDGGVLHVDSPH